MSVVREGVVVDGEYLGWTALVDDDRNGDTGGYYLYLKKVTVKGLTFDSSTKPVFKLN